ncbi:MAG: hypothetical protein CMM00_01820, partial [Rhodopirellula sp.]|nr:hypothetical protein [Rhodopirellula sp.]
TLMSNEAPEQRIENAFLQLSGRRPDTTELEELVTLYQQEQTFFEKDIEAAKSYLSIGERELPSDVSLAELAATTSLCQVILNLDATIWKR